jgi:hypothetical protein
VLCVDDCVIYTLSRSLGDLRLFLLKENMVDYYTLDRSTTRLCASETTVAPLSHSFKERVILSMCIVCSGVSGFHLGLQDLTSTLTGPG